MKKVSRNRDKKNSNKKVTRVGIFQWCKPHYRLGIFRALQRRDDMEFTICAPNNPKADFLQTNHKEKGLPFVNIKSWRLKIPLIKKFITFQPYSIWSLITKKFDVIIMPNDFSDICVWVNLILGRILGRKVCLWGPGTTNRYVIPSRFARGIIMHLARAVIFYTEGPQREWIDRGFCSEKLFVAYNALDTNVSEAIKNRLSEENLDEFRRCNGLEGKKVVIFTGRLQPSKRPDILVRTMKVVVQSVPNAYAVIIGDGLLRQELERLIQELQLTKSVTLTGAIHDEELIARYMLCSVIQVLPGNAGLGIQHAFGYSTPVITHDDTRKQTPEIELVINGVTGFLCRDGDVADFARSICRLLTDDVLRRRLAENAYQVIREKYNMENMTTGFFEAVQYCIES